MYPLQLDNLKSKSFHLAMQGRAKYVLDEAHSLWRSLSLMQVICKCINTGYCFDKISSPNATVYGGLEGASWQDVPMIHHAEVVPGCGGHMTKQPILIFLLDCPFIIWSWINHLLPSVKMH